MNNTINLRCIFKRERFLEKRKAITESATIPHITSSNINSLLIRNKINDFINECSSYEDAITLLESLYENNKFDLLEENVQKVVNDIIPLTEVGRWGDLLYRINQSNIGDVNKDRLKEAATTYKVADRVKKNHNNLSKRFSMDDFKGKSDREKCFKVCEMVSTYSCPFASKLNIAIEELTYLGILNGDSIKEDTLVKNVLEYFMMTDYKSSIDSIGDYSLDCVKHSKILSENAFDQVSYIKNNKGFGWRVKLNEWLISDNKSIDSLVSIIRENYSDVNAINTLIEYINEFTRINEIEFDPIKIFDEFNTINADEAENIVSIIKENNISNTDDLLHSINCIWEAELNDSIYDDGTEKPETFTSDEIDRIKMHNLVTDSQAAGEFLDHLEKTSAKEYPVKIKRVYTNESINLNENNLVNNIDANGYIDIKLRSYVVEGNINNIKKFVENSIGCINNILYNRSSKAFYTINENRFDVSIRSKYKIILTEQQEYNKKASSFDIAIADTINRYSNSIVEIADSSEFNAICDKLNNDRDYAASISVDEAVLIQEMLNPFFNREDGLMHSFIGYCNEEANPNYDRIAEACEAVKEESYDPFANNMERIHLCYQLVMESENDEDDDFDDEDDDDFDDEDIEEDEDKDTNEEDDDKNKSSKQSNDSSVNKNDKNRNTNSNRSHDEDEKKKLNLNDIKLAWQGVKSKFKKASAKEQEICRDIDTDFNHLVQTIKSDSPDKRREVITGEINISLSRIVKKAIALAGTGAVVGATVGAAPELAILTPVLGLIMSFVKSRYTTDKEKRRIIDEIDVELKVVEREINRAEQDGSSKKYRRLLAIQRNLQRKRQEIYYNLARRGKRIPISHKSGLGTGGDD